MPEVYEILKRGCDIARAAAAQTLRDVHAAMKINYFEDTDLVEQQAARRRNEL